MLTGNNNYESQSSDQGSNPARGLYNREWDNDALRTLLRMPPCITCKKEQASIELHDYCLWKPRSNSNSNYDRVMEQAKQALERRFCKQFMSLGVKKSIY